MLLIFIPIYLHLLLQSLSLTNAENVLVNAPTFLEKHLDESILLARILAEDGHHVHLLFMNSGDVKAEVLKKRVEDENTKITAHKRKEGASGSNSPHPKSTMEKPKGKLKYEIVKLPSDFVKSMKEGNHNPHDLVGNKWQKRGTTQNEKILENEAFHVYQKFLESPEAKETMHELKGKNFKYGLFDTWDFGAQYIFFLLGIPKENVVAFNKISLLSYQMEYAGKFANLLDENVPEVYAAKIGDVKAKEMKKHHYEKEHKENMAVFTKVHGEMDKWFHEIEHNQAPKISELYKGVKYIFVDSHPALDFELGTAKPANAEYIGGITLLDRLVEKKGAEGKQSEQNPLVFVSLDLCYQLLDEKNLTGFRAFLDAFQKFGHEHSINFPIDCKDKESEMEAFIKKGGYSKNVYVETGIAKNLQEAIFHWKPRLLISSCSGGPVIDALGAGVPLICVPLMVDQYYISQALQLGGRKVSITLDTNKIMKGEKSALQIGGEIGKREMAPKDVIYEALKTILDTEAKTYLEAAHKLQEQLHKSAFKAKKDFLAAFKGDQGSGSVSQTIHGKSNL